MPQRSQLAASTPVHAILLAAGGSSRLGQPKQLVRLGGRTLLRRAAEIALRADVASLTVVLGALASTLAPELDGLCARVVHNDAWRDGPGTSIRAGIRALREARPPTRGGALVLLCDQLAVDAAHLCRLIAAFREGGTPIAVASAYAGTIGVPAIFAEPLWEELAALPAARGGKEILARHSSALRAVPLPRGDRDLDTPEDLMNARGM